MDNPKEKLKPVVPPILYILLSLVLGYALSMVGDSFYIQLKQNISHKALSIIIIILIPAFFILLYYYFYYNYHYKNHNTSTKLKLLYTICWDKKGNPYCPVCKTPIQPMTQYNLMCPNNNCSLPIIPKDINGKNVPISKISNEVKIKWKELEDCLK